MDFVQFSSDTNVRGFVEWFCLHHDSIPVQLNLKSTRYVPGGLRACTTGFSSVLDHYRWKSAGMANGDWTETSQVLHELSAALTTAVDTGDGVTARQAVRNILTWGGNRNYNAGAWPFIQRMNDTELVTYLRQTRQIFSLEEAHLPPASGQHGIGLMNAMLTKVHALNTRDGLPIYDSRVAAAIACLVEMWRSATGLTSQPLPATLTFPPTDARRTVTAYAESASNPRMMQQYAAPTQMWSDCKIRLGWLIRLILEQDTSLFSDLRVRFPGLPQANGTAGTRAHAFESTLFMIGYDPGCLVSGDQTSKSTERRVKYSVNRSKSRLQLKVPYDKTTGTLSGRGSAISYESRDGECNFLWKKTHYSISEELLNEIVELIEDAGAGGILLSANNTGTPKPGSLGEYLKNNGYSTQLGSAIAAILCSDKMIHCEVKKSIRLFSVK